LFDGKKVSHVLPFTRPMYNQTKLAATPGRLSISGIQTKMSLRLSGTQLEMIESGGQYILKPIPQGEFQHQGAVPINEHLTMQMAQQVFRMAVAGNALVTFADGETAYLARRFDVQEDGSRSLQEDFAQVGQRSEETHGKNYKYDFSYEEMGGLIRKHVAAHQVEMEKFVQLVAFNYLIHNGDAHLKNFSLILNNQYGDYTLMPAYDLLNTRLHVPDETQTALPLFKDDFETASFQANGFYAYDDFHELARRLELRQARFGRLMQSFRDKEGAVFSLVDRSMLSKQCKELYKRHVQDSIKALSYSRNGFV
jgi:serine/threonine-protein kinase HipA